MHNPATCTVTNCGAPAVWSNGEFAECAQHAADPGALARADRRHAHSYGHRVGDHVAVHRYGKVYDAIVTYVGPRGAAYATFRYDNGAERTVRV